MSRRDRVRRLERHQRAADRDLAERAALLALVTGRPVADLLAEVATSRDQVAALQQAGEDVTTALAAGAPPSAVLAAFFSGRMHREP